MIQYNISILNYKESSEYEKGLKNKAGKQKSQKTESVPDDNRYVGFGNFEQTI